jgi:hypothetical protein
VIRGEWKFRLKGKLKIFLVKDVKTCGEVKVWLHSFFIFGGRWERMIRFIIRTLHHEKISPISH